MKKECMSPRIGGSDLSNKRREIDDETIRRADLYVVHSKEVALLDQSPDVWEIAQRGIKTWEYRFRKCKTL